MAPQRERGHTHQPPAPLGLAFGFLLFIWLRATLRPYRRAHFALGLRIGHTRTIADVSQIISSSAQPAMEPLRLAQ